MIIIALTQVFLYYVLPLLICVIIAYAVTLPNPLLISLSQILQLLKDFLLLVLITPVLFYLFSKVMTKKIIANHLDKFLAFLNSIILNSKHIKTEIIMPLLALPIYIVFIIYVNTIIKFSGPIFTGLIQTLIFLSFVLLGVLAYLVRSNFRSLYGYMEISTGAYAVWQYLELLIDKKVMTHDLIEVFSSLSFFDVFPISAGVYIIVRGLDNVSKDLPEWLEPIWIRYFGPPS